MLVAGCRGGCLDDDRPPEVQAPLYKAQVTRAHPLAARLCRAIHTLPAERRAACCGLPVGLNAAGLCEAALTDALADGAITIDDAELARCESAMAAAHEGCGWIGPLGTAVAPECARLIGGTRASGEACRSTLECVAGLRCAGGGVNDAGKCAPPAPDRHLCNFSVDALVTYARQDGWPIEHPECLGYCERNRCAAPVALGEPCQSNAMCGRGNRCSEGRCVGGARGQLGDACLGDDCAFGLRCYGRRCGQPKALGEACSSPFECLADCVDGRCAMGCGQLPPILRPRPAPAATSTISSGSPAERGAP